MVSSEHPRNRSRKSRNSQAASSYDGHRLLTSTPAIPSAAASTVMCTPPMDSGVTMTHSPAGGSPVRSGDRWQCFVAMARHPDRGARMPQKRRTVPALPAHSFGHSVESSGTRQHEAPEGNPCRGARTDRARLAHGPPRRATESAPHTARQCATMALSSVR